MKRIEHRPMTITDFLFARINEDEVEASESVMYPGDCTCHYPARVLAECKAKRTLIEGHAPYSYHESGPFSPMSEACLACDAAWPCITMLAFADIYADHPGYQQEWAFEPISKEQP